ncbi:hypothetical protein [Halalkalicoccus sp. NIPERK01]|nr:hypothetical protein [Halalkalicoccus sp. NIPERK01]MDL5363513.1 hypothetical protein [Halalkalicoccus sp. NIPERK01]
MNVLEVLTVTTALYFACVAVWVLKLEDLLEERTDRRSRRRRGES